MTPRRKSIEIIECIQYRILRPQASCDCRCVNKLCAMLLLLYSDREAAGQTHIRNKTAHSNHTRMHRHTHTTRCVRASIVVACTKRVVSSLDWGKTVECDRNDYVMDSLHVAGCHCRCMAFTLCSGEHCIVLITILKCALSEIVRKA